MQKEYDFSKDVRAKYANTYADKTLTLTATQWKTLKSLMKMKSFDNSK